MSKFDPKHSGNKLKAFKEKLVQLREKKPFTNKEIALCIIYISKIEEYLLDDNKDQTGVLFDAICECNIAIEYLALVGLNIKDITFAILKSLSILILSIKRVQILYLFYSNDLINLIILSDFKDDDYLSYQINFMKSLSLKLNKDTINFFYNEDTNRFPLLEKTFELRSNSDGMIRNVVRNIILTLLKIEDEKLNNYFTSYPIVFYFANLILSLKPKILQLDKYNGKFNQIKDIHDEIVDSLYFIQDIFSLGIVKINQMLVNSLVTQMIIPFINTVISSKANQRLSKQSALYFLLLLLSIMKHRDVVDILIYLLFADKISESVNAVIKTNTFSEFDFDSDQDVLLSCVKLEENSASDIEMKNFLFINCGYFHEVNTKMKDPNGSSVSKILDLDGCIGIGNHNGVDSGNDGNENGKKSNVVINDSNNSNKGNQSHLCVNDVNWNIVNIIKQSSNSEERMVLLVYLLIHTAKKKKDIDINLLMQSSLLYENETVTYSNINDINPNDNNQVVMLDSDSNEDANEKVNKKRLYLLELLFEGVSINYLHSTITTKLHFDLLSNEIMRNIKLISIKNKEAILEAYILLIGVLKAKISNTEQYIGIGYELFLNAFNEYNTLTKPKYDRIVLDPWLLIPESFSINISNYPSYLCTGSNEYDIFSQLLVLFMSLYNLQAAMNNTTPIEGQNPITFEGKELEIGQTLSIGYMQYDYSECQIKQGDSSIRARLIFLGNYLYVGKLTSKENEFNIAGKMPIRRAEIKIDNKNKTMILLSDVSMRPKKIISTYELIFRSEQYTSQILAFLYQKKGEICDTEYILFSSYFESLGSIFL